MPRERKPYGVWTKCSCGHIAQDHGASGMCHIHTCGCGRYDGHCIPKPRPDSLVKLTFAEVEYLEAVLESIESQSPLRKTIYDKLGKIP